MQSLPLIFLFALSFYIKWENYAKFQRAAGGKGKNALQYPGAKKSMFSGRENVSRETLLPVKCLQYVFGSGNGMRKIFS
jgi:hypothetical protein